MKLGIPSWNASRPSMAVFRRCDRASKAASIDVKSVSPPTGGRILACRIEAAGGVSSNVTSLCQMALYLLAALPLAARRDHHGGIVGVAFKPGVRRVDLAEAGRHAHQVIGRQFLAWKEQDLVFEPCLAQGSNRGSRQDALRSIPETSAPM